MSPSNLPTTAHALTDDATGDRSRCVSLAGTARFALGERCLRVDITRASFWVAVTQWTSAGVFVRPVPHPIVVRMTLVLQPDGIPTTRLARMGFDNVARLGGRLHSGHVNQCP